MTSANAGRGMTNDRGITNDDKAEALRNEQRLRKGDREATSYHRLAGLADDLGGRFAAEAGEEAATKYPEQSSGPWSAQPGPGVEPPLGEDINFVAPVGEQWEIDASIAEQAIGEPEPGASTQSRVPNQQLMGAVEGLGSSPSQERRGSSSRASDAAGRGASWGSVASTHQQRCEEVDPTSPRTLAEAGSNNTASVVKSQAVNSAACDETPRPSHSTKPRRKVVI